MPVAGTMARHMRAAGVRNPSQKRPFLGRLEDVAIGPRPRAQIALKVLQSSLAPRSRHGAPHREGE